ncbi:MAG: ABC transporter transmembrane domain-containing protein, partial [Tateyamaria sp.]
MTDKRPFTLTITNGNRARIKAAPTKDTPKADNANHAADRLRARADVAVAFAGLLGVTTSRTDVQEALATRTGAVASDKAEANALAAALRGTGLQAQVSTVRALTSKHWPALAYMTSGQVVLVVGQDRDDLVIYDTTCPDNRAHVPIAEFTPFFAGLLVRAEAPLARVAETHRAFAVKDHWFWGQFPRFRKALAEIALGSFVANLLAVAVALFSLQVYDRVIPHQSEATLWVLAAGAFLALLLEAFIKIARARLMDGAGRQIELSVLTLLMQRVMGMRSDARDQSPSMTFSAMREFGSVREFFTASTIGTIADIPFIFVFLLLVASIAGPVVWVLILGGILMVVPGFFLQKRMLRLTQETQGASAKSSRLLHEAIFERDTVKTQRAEDRVMR